MRDMLYVAFWTYRPPPMAKSCPFPAPDMGPRRDDSVAPLFFCANFSQDGAVIPMTYYNTVLSRLKNKTHSLLRGTEKYTKTDMLYLVKGGSWLTLGQGASTVVGLALAVGFANLLPQDVYGVYSFVLSLAGIIAVFTLSGLRTAITQAVARGYEGTLRLAFLTSMKWSALMTLAGGLGALYYFLQGNNTLAVSLLIIGSFSPLMVSAALYSGFLNGKKEFRAGSIYNTAANAVPALALLATIALTDNVLSIVFVYFLSHTTVNLLFYWRTLRTYRPSDAIEPGIISYSKHLSVMNVVSTVADYLDRILVFHYLGAVQLAVYSFAIAVPTQLRGLLRNINSLIAPKFAAGDKELARKSLNSKTAVVGLVSTLAVLAYILAAPYIYRIFFPQYLDAVFYSQLFALMIIPATMGIVSTSFLVAHREQKLLYIINTVSPLVRIGLLLVLGYLYGITGIIAALIASKTLNFFFIAILARRT